MSTRVEAIEASPAAVSARRIVSVMSTLFALIAVAVPIALRVPAWERIEAIVGAWWLVAMGVVAYAGVTKLRIREDHRFVPFWRRFRDARYEWMFDGFGIESPLTTVIALVALLVLIPTLWIVIEAIAPLLFLLLYLAMLPVLRSRSVLSIAFLTSIAAFSATAVWAVHML